MELFNIHKHIRDWGDLRWYLDHLLNNLHANRKNHMLDKICNLQKYIESWCLNSNESEKIYDFQMTELGNLYFEIQNTIDNRNNVLCEIIIKIFELFNQHKEQKC